MHFGKARERIVYLGSEVSYEMTSKLQAVTTPRCIVIAGPNGAGKTTFAREFLPKDTDVIHFVNADLIASGLSALKPEIAALSAGVSFWLNWTDSRAVERVSLSRPR